MTKIIMNLTNYEKQLVTAAYYHGSADNEKTKTPKEMHPMLDRAARLSATKLLEELGLQYPDIVELYKFYEEMEEITLYLCKEKKHEV